MAWPIIVAWMHYVSIMLMVASLLGEHLLLKPELTMAKQGRSSGSISSMALRRRRAGHRVLRMFLEKGAAYYNHHIAFHILVGIFVIAALLSIYPTVVFLRWRADTKAGQGQQLAAAQFRKIQMIVRAEMTLLLLAPFFATWMAHGEF